MVEASIEGQLVRIDVGPLADWEALAWSEQAALAASVLAAVGVAVWGYARGRTRVAKALGAALPSAAGVLGGAGSLAARLSEERSSGEHVLRLVGELGARFDAIGLFAWPALGIAAGALAGVLLDVPAWRERPLHAQLPRAACALVALGLAAASIALSAPALAHREVLEAIRPLPFVATAEDLELHVGQSREVELGEITALGVRLGAPTFLWFGRPRRVLEDPGSPADRAALARGEHVRELLSTDDLAAWSLGGAHTLRAPSEPGPFRQPLVVRRGPVTVESGIDAVAIDDAPDPLFPLQVGVRRVFARATQRGRGPVVEDGRITLEVAREEVIDGFRRVVVRVVDTPAEGSERVAPPPRELAVIPWEGTYRTRARGDAPRFVSPIEPIAASEGGAAPPEDVEPEAGRPCRVELLPGFACACVEGPRAGPTRCVHAGSNAVETLVLGGLALVTAGLTWFLGARPGPAPVTELRLVEADGAVVDTPSRLEAPRRRARR